MGTNLSSRDREVSTIAFIDSTINVASSGPRIASMIDGSSFVDGATGGSTPVFVFVLEDWLVAHVRSSFARLSIVVDGRGWTLREI